MLGLWSILSSFLCIVRGEGTAHIFPYGYLINYSSTVLFLHLSWHFCWNQLTMCESVRLSVYPYPTITPSWVWLLCVFQVKSGNVSSPALFFLKLFLAILGLYFHKHFRISLPISIKKFWEFGITLNL